MILYGMTVHNALFAPTKLPLAKLFFNVASIPMDLFRNTAARRQVNDEGINRRRGVAVSTSDLPPKRIKVGGRGDRVAPSWLAY